MKKLLALVLGLLAFAPPAFGQANGSSSVGSSAAVQATIANTSHSAGQSLGGLFTIPIARIADGSGVITSVLFKSVGGSTAPVLVRLWDYSPANTTCTDNTAFAGSDTDDQHLIAAPFAVTPAAPTSTVGDSSTYGASTGLTISFRNQDGSKNIYACLVVTSTDTADENKVVRLTVLGTQN